MMTRRRNNGITSQQKHQRIEGARLLAGVPHSPKSSQEVQVSPPTLAHGEENSRSSSRATRDCSCKATRLLVRHSLCISSGAFTVTRRPSPSSTGSPAHPVPVLVSLAVLLLLLLASDIFSAHAAENTRSFSHSPEESELRELRPDKHDLMLFVAKPAGDPRRSLTFHHDEKVTLAASGTLFRVNTETTDKSGFLHSSTEKSTGPSYEGQVDADRSHFSTQEESERQITGIQPTADFEGRQAKRDAHSPKFPLFRSSSAAARLASLGYIVGPPYVGENRAHAQAARTAEREKNILLKGQQHTPSSEDDRRFPELHYSDVFPLGDSSNRGEEKADFLGRNERGSKDYHSLRQHNEGENNTQDRPSNDFSEPAKEGQQGNSTTPESKQDVSAGGNASVRPNKKSSFTVEFKFGPSSSPSDSSLPLYLLPVADGADSGLLPAFGPPRPFTIPSAPQAANGNIPPASAADTDKTRALPSQLDPTSGSLSSTSLLSRQPADLSTVSLSTGLPVPVTSSTALVGLPLSQAVILVPVSLLHALPAPAVLPRSPPHRNAASQISPAAHTDPASHVFPHLRGRLPLPGETAWETTSGGDAHLVFHLPPLRSVFSPSLPFSFAGTAAQDGLFIHSKQSVFAKEAQETSSSHNELLPPSSITPVEATSSVFPTPPSALAPETWGSRRSPLDSILQSPPQSPPIPFGNLSASSQEAATSVTPAYDSASPASDLPPESSAPEAPQPAPRPRVNELDADRDPAQAVLAGQGLSAKQVPTQNLEAILDYIKEQRGGRESDFVWEERDSMPLWQLPHSSDTHSKSMSPKGNHGDILGFSHSPGVASGKMDEELETKMPGRLVELALQQAAETVIHSLASEGLQASPATPLLEPLPHSAWPEMDLRASGKAGGAILPQLGSLFALLTGIDSDQLRKFFTGSVLPPVLPLNSGEHNSPPAATERQVPPTSSIVSVPVEPPAALLPSRSIPTAPQPPVELTESSIDTLTFMRSVLPSLEALTFGLHLETPETAQD
ncbi:hypothetical protein BESB_058760 [Besnoitia besnoiti]|uniref:Uncharacterized protein n=1 Tax=Besnoitia besnoiti TaxID=94643 RepID=A0A2A9MAQ7_BESBE|nr:hypothetical protein BESB_058760 [Besnoitia besnoiti]PFH34989.1 hypothetical protein BESB_058760 [Besnoitia besnoiti]